MQGDERGRPAAAARLSNPRWAGATAIAGAAVMLAGAATWASTGTDLDGALTGGAIGDYLRAAAATSTALRVNLSLWIIGVLLMGAGGCQLALLGHARPAAALLACFCYTAGAGAAVVFFPLWLGIVVGLAPAHAAGDDVGAVGVALGQAATIADWFATVLILAGGSVGTSLAGRDDWVPRWLLVWSFVVAAAGVLALVGVAIGQRTTFAMLVIPVGLTWLIAAGVTAIRSAR